MLRWRLKASGVFGSLPNSRRFHAEIGTSASLQLGGTTCNHKCQIKEPRRRRWSPKEVAEIFDFTFSGSLDSVAEGNHSWSEHPEPFIDDRDDHRSSRVALNARPSWWVDSFEWKCRRHLLVVGIQDSFGRFCICIPTPFLQRFQCSIQARALKLTSSVKKMVWRWVLMTLQALTNEDRRPVTFREPLPQFSLDDNLFFKTLRSARRGAACGPSGMTYEHLLRLLNYRSDFSWVNVSPGPRCHSQSLMPYAWDV